MLYLGRMYDTGDTLPRQRREDGRGLAERKKRKVDRRGRRAQQSAQEDGGENTDGSQDSQGQNEGQEGRKTARRPKWWRDTWIPTSCPP